MYRKYGFWTVLIVLLTIQSHGQNSCEQRLAADNLGNRYLYNDQSIRKYDKVLGQEVVFSTPDYGAVGKVEVQNPNLAVVFYPESQVLINLNRDLNQVGDPILLTEFGMPFQITHMACNSQRKAWFYDWPNQELIQFDLSTKQVITRVSLLPVNYSGLEVLEIYADLDLVCLELKNGVYLLFNGLGVFQKKVILKSDGAKWIKGTAYYLKGETLLSYNPDQLKERLVYKFPSIPCDFYINDRQVYWVDARGQVKSALLN